MKKILIPMFALGAAFAMQPSLTTRRETPIKSKACLSLQHLGSKIVGPAPKRVSPKNADVEGAVDTLALHIKEGSAGVWGPIPMPANAVTEEEAKILAEWVLSLK